MRVKYLLNVFLSFTYIILLSIPTNGLYEDQIKKFDWGRNHVGIPKYGYLDVDNDRVIVGTEQNIVAALSAKTGSILWRVVLERSPRGDIKFFKYNKHSTGLVPSHVDPHSADIRTVSGYSPALIRSWAANSGILQREWSLQPFQVDKAENGLWFEEDMYLYHVIPVWNSHLEVTKYIAATGYSKNTTTKISTPWIENDKCELLNYYFVCLSYNQLIAIDLTLDESKIIRREVSHEPDQKLAEMTGHRHFVIVGDSIVSLSEAKPCSNVLNKNVLYAQYQDRKVFIKYSLKDKKLHFSAVDAETCTDVPDVEVSLEFPSNYGEPTLLDFECKHREKTRCSFLVSTTDGALLLIEQGKIRWSREESLANIIATELVDLPLSDEEGAIENELKSKPEESGDEWDIFGAFTRRITAQISHIKHTILAVLGLGLPPTASQKAGLVRDAFGLHKMIVFVTKTGKLFGIDNLSGKQHWAIYLPTVTNFNEDQPMQLMVQRTAKHFPHQPICILLGKNPKNGNGIIYRFNPITGQSVDGAETNLNYKIKQIALTHEVKNDYLKALLILDQESQPHVIPPDAASLANGMYMFTADRQKGTLNGYFISASNLNLKAKHIWGVSLGGYGNNHKIVAVAGKNPIEHVHSQGRVLSDRSVLYKYINPNLVAVVTQAPDNIHKFVMNIHLVDVVSGSVVFSMTHRKIRGPLHIVHSENWLVYSYYNDKVRRTEITTIELYEGEVQANGTVWSSLDSPPMPLVEKQSYIFPATIETMRETITEKGITNKHILIGVGNGGIVEMPWALLDPRRPVSMPNQVREEGSIPYIPELPIPTENIINYNQSIPRIKNIYTAPSGLESTCLMVAYGIDLFVTRVSPSKTFDLLKEDFDYFLITIVLTALTTGSFIVKHLSSRKALKQAWK